MLNVSPDSWHYQVYRWWLRTLNKNRPEGGENLCHYMRVVLLYSPLLWCLTPRKANHSFSSTPIIVVMMAALGCVLVFLLWSLGSDLAISIWGEATILATLVAMVLIPLTALAVISTLAALVVGIVLGLPWLWKTLRQWISGTAQTAQPSGFARLFREWLVGLHQRVCPVLDLPAEIYDHEDV